MTDYQKTIAEAAESANEFVMLEDGFVYWWPEKPGAYSSAALRALADELDKRNAEWDAIVQKEFS